MAATPEQLEAWRGATERHAASVAMKAYNFLERLLYRIACHDRSKLEEPEASIYAVVIPKLKGLPYSSDEAKATLDELGPAWDHHAANNRHHPEFHAEGLAGMTLLDLVEMLCDWKSANEERDLGADFLASLDVSAERYGIDPQLLAILKNTIKAEELSGLEN